MSDLKLLEIIPQTSERSKPWVLAALKLAPLALSGYDVCPKSSRGCAAACFGITSVTKEAMDKTRRFFEDRPNFLRDLEEDIRVLLCQAYYDDKRLAISLNWTSDILWERIAISMEYYDQVQFFDSTRHDPLKRRFRPKNYHLSYSLDSYNKIHTNSFDALSLGWPLVKVVKNCPHDWYAKDCLLFLEEPCSEVYLRPQGHAKLDKTGWVR